MRLEKAPRAGTEVDAIKINPSELQLPLNGTLNAKEEEDKKI